jgi:HKD family nuclease
MRRNVLNWLTAEIPNARHAVILTHNIHFLFVQSVLTAKLRQAGNPRLTIFADAMCAGSAFAEQHALLDGLGVRYRVVPVDLGPGRRFHPKALLLVGPERAALAIGSGNLTHGGMAANHEAWTFAVSDGDGAALIGGFRSYMETLVQTLPLAEPLKDGLDAVFDPTQSWVADLPPAAGLAGSPDDIPLLDQLARSVTGDVRAVSVLAPYYDPEGVALSTIANRFGVPVTCWMQPGRAGLSQIAAGQMPANVVLKSIDCEESRRPSFIHAKVLAFHRDENVVLAVGSANCSQAALLAQRSWGNAELMAIDTISHGEAEAFFASLVRSDDAPDLPAEPPSDDWDEMVAPPLRILAARHESDRLDVAYRAAGALTDLIVEAETGAWPAVTVDSENGLASFSLPQRLRTITLSARDASGGRVASAEAWVDDEASLSAPATLRRVLRRLQDGEGDDTNPAQAFRGVLDLFRDYLRDPEAARRRMKRRDDAAQAPGAYDPAAVFSEHFGSTGIPISRGGVGTHTPTSVLSIIEALFAVSREVGGAAPRNDARDDDGEEPDPESIEAALIQKVRAAPDDKAAAQLRRALVAVGQALCEPAFVETRSATLLGSDLALAAVLLVKGLADGLLDVASFRESTRALWGALFFGGKGAGGSGSLPSRIQNITDAGERYAFVAALATPRLASALVLWSVTEWNAGDADALWFRFSAARLQERCPWLFAAASPEVLTAELQVMAGGLLPPNEQTAAMRTWTEVVRAGQALRTLNTALANRNHADLRTSVKALQIGRSDLVWANSRLGFPMGSFRREDGVKAQVQFLGEAIPARYYASHLLPVLELVQADALDLPDGAKGEILKLIDAAVVLQPAALG